jgi:GT2 family glycosyltransferase
MKKERPLVSIIVVTFNEINHISASLEALMKQTYPNFEVIVYDNGSTDGTSEYVKKHYPQVKLVNSRENLGFGGANNAAAVVSKGKYIGFLNCDAIVAPDWLLPIVELLESDPTIGCAGAELRCTENPEMILSHGTSIHLSGVSFARDRGKLAFPADPIEVGGISGGAFVMNRAFFLEIGGFESLFFLYYEDTDLSIRIRLLGKRCVVVPRAHIYHNCESRFGVRKVFFLERNRYLSLFTLMNNTMLWLMAPSILVFEIFSWGYCFLNGRGAIESKINAWKAIYQHRDWVKIRRKKYARLEVKTSYVLQAFTPVVDVDYVHPNKAVARLSSFTGFLLAMPVFVFLRLFTGRSYLK